MVRNEDYWGEKPHLKRIVYKIITEPTVALQVLKQRGLDYMGLLPIQWMKQTQSKRFEDEFAKFKYYQPTYRYIGWNNRRPVFSDRRVRQALTMLLDRRPFHQEGPFRACDRGLGDLLHQQPGV